MKKQKSEASSAVDHEAWFKEHDIVIQDIKENDWKPFLEFSECGLADDVLAVTKSFKNPTPIQSTCWPMILANRDVVGIAETGMFSK